MNAATTKKCWVLLPAILGAVSIFQFPALAEAETRTHTGNSDKHLYIVSTTTSVTEGSTSWQRGSGRGSVYSGPHYDIGIFKGNFRISDERFVALLTEQGIAPGLVQKYNATKALHILTSWGTLLAGTGMMISGFNELTKWQPGSLAYPLGYGGATIAGVGLGMVMIGPGRGFTWEEAADAVEAYNARLDRR